MNSETRDCRNARRRADRRRAQPAFAEDVVIKVWSRADRSGPLRAGNIVAAGDTLNKMLAAINSDKRVKIELNETNAKGYDDDALDLLKAFAVDKGPDIFVLAHEWTGAFAEAGYALNLEDHIAKNPELYGDIIAPLWQAVTLQGRALRRAAGLRSAHVLPQQRQAAQDRHDRQGDRRAAGARSTPGEFTANDLCDLAGQAVQKGVVKYGILHRPNAGPDFQMLTDSFGLEPYDKAAAKLQASKAALRSFYTWVKYCVDKKALSREQHGDVVGRDRAGVVRRRGSARVLPRRLARDRPDEGVEAEGQGRLSSTSTRGSTRRPARRAASRRTCRTRSHTPCRPSRRTRISPPTSSRWRASRSPTCATP